MRKKSNCFWGITYMVSLWLWREKMIDLIVADVTVFFLSLTVLVSISSGIPNHSASIQVHVQRAYLPCLLVGWKSSMDFFFSGLIWDKGYIYLLYFSLLLFCYTKYIFIFYVLVHCYLLTFWFASLSLFWPWHWILLELFPLNFHFYLHWYWKVN